MKKTYSNPTIEAVAFHGSVILAGSVAVNGTADKNGEVLTRGFEYEWGN